MSPRRGSQPDISGFGLHATHGDQRRCGATESRPVRRQANTDYEPLFIERGAEEQLVRMGF